MKTKSEYVRMAQKRSGKQNTSFRWAKAWLLGNVHPEKLLPGLRELDSRVEHTPRNARVNTMWDSGHYRVMQAARTADREEKRARHDASFRRGWLRRINRKLDKLLNPPVRTLTEVTTAADSLLDRRIEAYKLAAKKSIALAKKIEVTVPHVVTGVIVRGFDASFARKHGVTGINMSGHDATIEATRMTSYGQHESGETTWKNGKPVAYTRATHDNYVRSFALIRTDDPRTVDYAFDTTEVALTLPDGYAWGVDANGLRVVHGADDLHPFPLDLLATNAVEKICGQLAANAERRRELAAQLLAEKAESEGVYCCVADSLRAGNCLAGTRAFAERHNLQMSRHYHAPELLSIANGDTSRVRLVIQSARNQSRIEMERGYALLADHTLPVS